MLNFQEMIAALLNYWAKLGCTVHQGYDLEVGAGTLNPATFLRCLGPEPYKTVYVEPSRRPKDGRYGENPNRVQFYHQMQVILKPSPSNLQDLYLGSLEAIGFDLNKHDIRFVHDDWENPTIGAWGLGWEIWADGMEVTQFTYFQTVGGIPVQPVSGELTYGLERLAMHIQGVDSIFDLKYCDQFTYGEIYKRSEWEWSHYNFKLANTDMWLLHFENFEKEAKRLIEANFPIPAYDFVMKCSHAFNILDARGVISVTERTGYIARIRNLANLVALSYIKSREEQNFPLLRQALIESPLLCPDASEKCAPEEKEDFLLEIGCEELPATFVPIGMQNLKNQFQALLDESGLSYGKITVYGTARRLAIHISKLAGGISSTAIEKKGPSKAMSFDNFGKPTKAGIGFFRSIHLEPPNLDEIDKLQTLEFRKIKGVEYLYATIKTPPLSTRSFLAKRLPALILKIDFPKKMRWGSLDIEFARPLRWIAALYGEEILPFMLGGLLSGRHSFGHRQLSNIEISLEHPKYYLEALRKHFVLADVEERKLSLLQQLKKLEDSTHAKAVQKEKVLSQVLHLVEFPFLTIATFDEKYLQAPKEVLISEMVEHQKYFPLVDEIGNLTNQFVVVCNNRPTDLIIKGNQKALSPRLADGAFLYYEDLKTPLNQFNEKLKTMTYLKDLGNMFQKVERLQSYTRLLYTFFDEGDLQKAMRAALLCKADLASELVGEFPELQGHIGKLYALAQNEDPEVAEAIEEHWMPKREKAPLPQTYSGFLVSLADKIDNFLSCFSLDLKPTSSSDPYALRRQALGMIKKLLEKKRFLPLTEVFLQAYDLFKQNQALSPQLKEKISHHKETLLNEIEAFFTSRLRSLFLESGFEKDEIEAALFQGWNCCYDLFKKLEALHLFRKNEKQRFLNNLEIHTRVKKILLSQNPQLVPAWLADKKNPRFAPVNPDLIKSKSETELFEKIKSTKILFSHSYMQKNDLARRDYENAFLALSELQAPLASLFEEVKIIDEDLAVRENRLSLLQEVWDLCEELVDFSQIQQD